MTTNELHDWLQQAKRAVFFGGAGMSTASGIPDFRSSAGLYTQQGKTGLPPEYLLSHSCLVQQPAEFFDFLRSSLLHPDAEPNAGHYALAQLEASGHVAAIVTQNIDGLHQDAGSKVVHELHGTTHRNYCEYGHHEYDMAWMLATTGIPTCPEDGTMVRPDIVLYEEGLDSDVIDASVLAISEADLLIVGGTSLNVYPAAGLLNYFKGEHLVLINRDPTPADRRADLVLHEPLEEALPAAAKGL